MAKDPLLRDSLKALKAKILIAADGASPEELAYLATAIDRIGGRATVLEVEEIGDVKIEEISAHADATQATTFHALDTARDDATSYMDAIKADATEFADIAVQRVKAASNEAVATAQAAANSVTQQLVFGRKSFFFAQL